MTEDPKYRPYHYLYGPDDQVIETFTSAVWYDTATPAQWCIRRLREVYDSISYPGFSLRIVSDDVEHPIENQEQFVVWVRDVFSANVAWDFSTHLAGRWNGPISTIVIVGGGSAGCVLANRLSADGSRRVVLIEAGPDYDAIGLPRDLSTGGRNSFHHHDWGHTHKPNSRQITLPLPRGKVVGGSSAVNTCIALRGFARDYAEWGWDWADCLNAFTALETDLDFPDASYHGDDGSLPIRRHPESEWTVWQGAFVDACKTVGFATCDDFNAPDSEGVGAHPMNKIGGRRISVAEAFLAPHVRDRENLEIVTHSYAQRLVFRGDRATGVEIKSSGVTRIVEGDEIVLCCGAINTPHLLMRSGVGPKQILQSWGVEVVSDQQGIGDQLLDHPGFAIFFRPRWGVGTSRKHDLIQTACRLGDDLMQPGSTLTFPRFSLPFVSLMAMLGKPTGRGRISWTSAHPDAKPTIESRLLDDANDREAAIKILERLIALSETPALRKIARPLYPLPRTLRDRSRHDSVIRKICDSGYHPCGTVPMGEGQPCDSDGRVRGTRNLRVVDASLMPTIPHANIHLSVLLIAERLSTSF